MSDLAGPWQPEAPSGLGAAVAVGPGPLDPRVAEQLSPAQPSSPCPAEGSSVLPLLLLTCTGGEPLVKPSSEWVLVVGLGR